jgi:hypothetical protein
MGHRGSIAIVVAGALSVLAPIAPAHADDDTLRSTVDVALWTAAGCQLGHQLDHFGRKDFAAPAVVLPLLFYTTHIGARYVLDGGPLYFTVVDSFWLIGFSITHFTGVVETPDTVYEKWTETDETIARSRAIGRVAQAVIIGGVVSLGAHFGLTLYDGRKNGFTWKRRRTESRVAVSPLPLREGGGLALAGTW